MRDIKFRAWDKELRKFHYPDLWDRSMPSNWRDWYELNQYTGLKDKNGKEIYEGDILKSGKTSLHYLVEWDNDEEARFTSACTDPAKDFAMEPYSWSRSEVIGNIYENPELLK